MATEIDRYGDAIARIESQGSGGYSAVGPTHPSMGRALGRYQVMESNLGPWLRDAGLPAMTPEQFLANPQAQDAVFRHRFGQYVQQFGPAGAAQAWFAGPGSVGAPGAENRRDSLGTSVASYVQRFAQGLGEPAALPSGATSAQPEATASQPAAGPPQDIQAIVAEMLRERQEQATAQAYANAAATDDPALLQMPRPRVPSLAPRRAVSTEQLRAGLASRRLGV